MNLVQGISDGRREGRGGRPGVCIVSHAGYGAITGGRSGFIGGVEWQTSLTARSLAARGYCVSMLTWDEGGPPEEVFDGVRVIKVCRQKSGLPGLRFLHPKWTGLIGAMRRADADVYYHNCGECVTGQMALWCHRNGRRLVFSAASDADCNPALPELKSIRERVLYRYGLRNADCVIAQTATQQRQFRENFGVESIVIPMPCPGPSDAQFVDPEAGAGRVLWVGRGCHVKRPDRYLDVAEQCPELKFDLVGPFQADPYARETQRRAQGIPNVSAHGPIARNRIGEFYRKASVLCCTSEYEGFPNTFLEAWSHGLPIISTFDPDGLISGRQLGIVVRDVGEMPAAIRELLANPQGYARLSKNARKYYSDNHTLEAVIPQFEQVFNKVVEVRRGAAAKGGVTSSEAQTL